jgi:hypothetical protein
LILGSCFVTKIPGRTKTLQNSAEQQATNLMGTSLGSSRTGFLRNQTKQHRTRDVRSRSIKVAGYYDITLAIQLGEC